MSSRYTLFTIDDLQSRFHLETPPSGLKPNYNISPTQLAPVIVSRGSKPTIEHMKWGLIAQGAKDANSVFRYKTFNTRSEGIFSKNSTNQAIRHNRCLVPANGYYEWQITPDGKKPYYIHAVDQPLFAIAGIYSSWIDPSGHEWGTYSIITCESNKDVDKIGTRMPVILHPDDESQWLGEIDTVSPLYELTRIPQQGTLIPVAVGPDINSIKINNPKLILPFQP